MIKRMLIAATLAAGTIAGAQAQSVMDDRIGPPMPAAAREHASRVVPSAAARTAVGNTVESLQPSWEISEAWRLAHQYNTDNGQ